LKNEVWRIKPDIIYSVLVEPNLLTPFLKAFSPRPKIIWGIRASNVRLEHYDWFARLNFKLQAFCTRFADLIIFQFTCRPRLSPGAGVSGAKHDRHSQWSRH